MSKALLVGLVAFSFAGLTLGCGPDVPANPTYTKDVKAIFDAHCVRCHGTNDMLISMPVGASDHPPKFCYLQRYENEGTCTADVGSGLQAGRWRSVLLWPGRQLH